MGNASYRQTTGNQYLTQDLRNYFQNDLPKFILQAKIGNGKFMKSYIMRVDGTPVVVKVYMKLNDEDLQTHAKNLTHLWKVLTPIKYPNLLPYQLWLRSTSRIKSNASPVYLIRQFFHTNLYDRLSIRPFWNESEKMFIVYQLLKCLEICHEHDIIHGDIKPENIMCTTSNWLILTDFSPFKPTSIPDDDPTDFQFYFDSMGRHRCYVAPERFFRRAVKDRWGRPVDSSLVDDSFLMSSVGDGPSPTKQLKAPLLTPAMDVFSVGCVIAEIFLDGVPLLDLPGMLQYVNGNQFSGTLKFFSSLDEEDSPSKSLLSRITNPMIKEIVVHMTQRDPEKRLRISEYLDILSGKCVVKPAGSKEDVDHLRYPFPSFFDSFLYPLFLKMHWNGVTPDDRVNIVCESYSELIKSISGGVVDDTVGADFFSNSSMRSTCLLSENKSQSMPIFRAPEVVEKDLFSIGVGAGGAVFDDSNKTNVPIGAAQRMRSISLARLRKESRFKNPSPSVPLYAKYKNVSTETSKDGLSDHLGFLFLNSAELLQIAQRTVEMGSCGHNYDYPQNSVSTLLNTLSSINFFKEASGNRNTFDGLVMVVDILNANYRHLKFPQSKLICLMLLTRLGLFCSDAVNIERIVPMFLVAIEDPCATVRAMALRALRSLLAIVTECSTLESNIFPLYIFPALSRVAKDQELVVKVAFAESIGLISEIAKKFLDRTHYQILLTSNDEFVAVGEYESVVEYPYHQKLDQLKDQISRWIRDLIIDSNLGLSGSSDGSRQNLSRLSAAAGSLVKRVLLLDIVRLCAFFGQESTMDKLLTQLLTFLNDQDWELRHAFCAKIPAVCAFLGPTITSECILPCIENAIYDVEEKVVVCALQCLATLAELSLLSKFILVDFTKKCKGLLLHPSASIREAAVNFVSIGAGRLGQIDSVVFLLPEIKDVVSYDLNGANELTLETIHSALVAPIPRYIFKKGLFDRIMNMSSFNFSVRGIAGPVHHQEDCDDAMVEKMSILSTYLDLAASEINTKTLQWRNSTNASGSTAFIESIRLRLMSNSDFMYKSRLDSLLENYPFSVPDHAVQCLLIPHQKYGIFYFPSLPEDLRRNTLYIDNDGIKNSNKLRMLFGITASQADAARALAVGSSDMWETQPSGPSVNSPPSSASQMSRGQQRSRAHINRASIESFNNLSSVLPSGTANQLMMKLRGSAQPAFSESVVLLKRIKALSIPPLPVDVGMLCQPDERKFSIYLDSLDTSSSIDSQNRTGWRPKENVLLTTLREHNASVNRIIVAPDQSYFGSASSDRTIKIWQTKNLDRMAFPRSVATYSKHLGSVTDATVIENSHSIASASDDGSVHVWRVDIANSSGTSTSAISNNVGEIADESLSRSPVVSGTSLIKTINSSEGSAVCVQHFNSTVASVVTFATQKGGIHGWDLRSSTAAFYFPSKPELGSTTAMSVAPDRNWIAIGSSQGFISLFDIRYNVCCKLYQHSHGSAINRLACGKSLSTSSLNGGVSIGNGSAMPSTEGAYLFVASGPNEAAVWGIPEAGECIKCFRTVPLDASRSPISSLPVLNEISLTRHPLSSISIRSRRFLDVNAHAVHAVIGRISQSNMSYLITAGTDKNLRFWDFVSPSKCYTISGLDAAQPKAIFDMPKLHDGSQGKLFICYVPATPSVDKILQAHLPIREGRGIGLPSNNCKDAILDLKNVDLPIRLLVSGSRDGEIKLWR